MDSAPSARVYDLDAYRARLAARRRSGMRRRFLWTWPATGQVIAMEFPSPASERRLVRAR